MQAIRWRAPGHRDNGAERIDAPRTAAGFSGPVERKVRFSTIMSYEVCRLETRLRTRPAGFTLIELIVATAILVILTGLAVPMARVAIKREKERELRSDSVGDARRDRPLQRRRRPRRISDQGGQRRYPPDLDTLVKGVDVGGKKVRFLRRIPAGSDDRQHGMGHALHAG